jgi:plasmid maintenance system antidote protein VapI
MAPEFWLNLQIHYALEQEHERLAGRLHKEVRCGLPREPAAFAR